MDTIKKNKLISILVIAVIYVMAAAFGTVIYVSLPFPFWADLLIADVSATVFVFVFSLIFGNASVYDPYWSVQPVVIITGFALTSKLSSATLLLIISIVIWGVRLTANWAYAFGGLCHQDWRYTKLDSDTGKFYPLINFLGIHMFPTLVVYCCVLPAVFVTMEGVNANTGSIIGTVICLGAAALQFFADTQMHRFRKSGRKGLIRTGLWKYSRHPNYLGEILMWWGIGVQAFAVMPQYWWFFAGAVLNTAMFFTISIPMADKRQSAKPGYAEYRADTRSLLPLPRLGR